MVHTFKQWFFTTMAMVCHKKKSINDGASRKSSSGEVNKHFGKHMQMLRETLMMVI
jgi:hypothetical protein